MRRAIIEDGTAFAITPAERLILTMIYLATGEF